MFTIKFMILRKMTGCIVWSRAGAIT